MYNTKRRKFRNTGKIRLGQILSKLRGKVNIVTLNMQDARTLNKTNTVFEASHLMKRKGLDFRHASAYLPCVNKSAARKAIWKIDNVVSLADGG